MAPALSVSVDAPQCPAHSGPWGSRALEDGAGKGQAAQAATAKGSQENSQEIQNQFVSSMGLGWDFGWVWVPSPGSFHG